MPFLQGNHGADNTESSDGGDVDTRATSAALGRLTAACSAGGLSAGVGGGGWARGTGGGGQDGAVRAVA